MPFTGISNQELDNLKMDCEICQEIVIYGDDYINHLKLVHSVKKNLAKFLDKKIKKNGEKRKAEEEVIDIDDDDDEEEDSAMISEDEEEALGEREIPEDVKEMVAEKVSSAMRNLLAPLYDILDEHSEEDSASPALPLTDDMPEDEELHQFPVGVEFVKLVPKQIGRDGCVKYPGLRCPSCQIICQGGPAGLREHFREMSGI